MASSAVTTVSTAAQNTQPPLLLTVRAEAANTTRPALAADRDPNGRCAVRGPAGDRHERMAASVLPERLVALVAAVHRRIRAPRADGDDLGRLDRRGLGGHAGLAVGAAVEDE